MYILTQQKQTVGIVCALLFAYVWLLIPTLSYYSLQAFALATAVFFFLKRRANANSWTFLPSPLSLEILFISFAITLLIGTTGNTASILYPLAYVHLFFLAMTTKKTTAIISAITVTLVHYSLEPALTTQAIASILSLPLMLLFFLFARNQYDTVKLQQKIVEIGAEKLETLSQKDISLESFVSGFLQPKLLVLSSILDKATHENTQPDIRILRTQIELLDSESKKLLKKHTSEQITNGDET